MKTRLEELNELIAYHKIWELTEENVYWDDILENYVKLRIEKYLNEMK